MILDELTILINADARGIDSILKRTLQTVTGTVNKMNAEEVDWTSIFTRAITPAVIGGIASMFAFAVAQSMSFQEAMNTTGTAAGESTDQIAQTGQAALAMSTQTGQSAKDTAAAMMQISAIFGTNTDDTKSVTEAMTELADSGFGSLDDIVKATIPLFKEFGVTTASQAIAMLTSLMHGAQASKESIATLANQFGEFSPALIAAGATVNSFNGLLSDFAGRIQALGATNANAIFQSLAASANSPVGPMELLGKNIATVQSNIVSGNVTGLVDDLSKKLATMGTTAQIVATNLGLTADQVNQFKITAKQLPAVDTDIKGVSTSTMTIKQAWDQSDSAIREFGKDWNKLVALFTASPISGFFKGLAEDIGKVIDFVQSLATDFVKLDHTELSQLSSGLSQITSFVMGGAGSALYDLLNPPKGPTTADINTILQGSNMGFGNTALSNIDTKASSANLVQALISALQSGLSSSSTTYSQLKNTFNLNVPSGGNLSAKDVATQLYRMFQGTAK
jgi:TP901 family phage tail tape measure protein